MGDKFCFNCGEELQLYQIKNESRSPRVAYLSLFQDGGTIRVEAEIAGESYIAIETHKSKDSSVTANCGHWKLWKKV